jgi:Ni,Fe-hydrogenase III small subunit
MSSSAAKAARRVSVWVLPLQTGGCGACTQSMYALQTPSYAKALAAAGVSFARSPRHADVILVSGPLTTASREAVRAVTDAAPLPRALVAVGNCAIDGCVFAGSPYITASAAEELDVNVEIAGCPPAPDAILSAIAEAADLLASAESAQEEGEAAAGAGAEGEAADEGDEADEAEETSDDEDDEDDETDGEGSKR